MWHGVKQVAARKSLDGDVYCDQVHCGKVQRKQMSYQEKRIIAPFS